MVVQLLELDQFADLLDELLLVLVRPLESGVQLLVLFLELLQLRVSDDGLEDLVEVALDGGKGRLVDRHLNALLGIKLNGGRSVWVGAVSVLAVVRLLGVRRCFRHNLGMGIFCTLLH